MASFIGYKPDEVKKIEARANEIFKGMKPRCDRGGCDFHSGHEFCSIDSAWEHAVSVAKDEHYENLNGDGCENDRVWEGSLGGLF